MMWGAVLEEKGGSYWEPCLKGPSVNGDLGTCLLCHPCSAPQYPEQSGKHHDNVHDIYNTTKSDLVFDIASK